MEMCSYSRSLVRELDVKCKMLPAMNIAKWSIASGLKFENFPHILHVNITWKVSEMYLKISTLCNPNVNVNIVISERTSQCCPQLLNNSSYFHHTAFSVDEIRYRSVFTVYVCVRSTALCKMLRQVLLCSGVEIQ